MTAARLRDAAGFTLVETLVALAMLAVLSAGVAWLTTLGARVLMRSSLDATMVRLAQGRLEQLRALAWSHGADDRPLSDIDVVTDLSAGRPIPGGPGLRLSPSGTLDADRPQYVDYSDRQGRWLGAGPPGPSPTRFVRRWAVSAVSGHPDLLLLRVRVLDRRRELPDMELVSMRVRTVQ